MMIIISYRITALYGMNFIIKNKKKKFQVTLQFSVSYLKQLATFNYFSNSHLEKYTKQTMF